METEIKNWVLVSQKIPHDFDVLDFHKGDESTNPIRPDWEYRVYEVPEWGSTEGVEVTASDRFVARVCGTSLEALDGYGCESGMIGDIRSWAGEYRLFAINGDYVILPVGDRHYRAFEPQAFGQEPFCSWDPEVTLGEDLTKQVFD